LVHEPECRSQILQATAVSPPDIVVRHKVAALRKSLAHTMNVVFGTFKTDVHKVHEKPLLLGLANGYQRTAARESCLDSEALMIPDAQARSGNHFPGGCHCGSGRVGGIDPFRDLIGLKQIFRPFKIQPSDDATLA
jgi:hypothetical protein